MVILKHENKNEKCVAIILTNSLLALSTFTLAKSKSCISNRNKWSVVIRDLVASSAVMTRQFNSLEADPDKMLAAPSVEQAELATHPLPAEAYYYRQIKAT